MASSRTDSNQVGGTKCFRHAVDSNGDRVMSMFDVTTVEPLELHYIASIGASDYLRVARLRTLPCT